MYAIVNYSDKVVIPGHACTARDTLVILSICRSFVRSFVHSFGLSVSLLGGSVSVHSASTRTWIAFIGHDNHANQLFPFSV